MKWSAVAKNGFDTTENEPCNVSDEKACATIDQEASINHAMTYILCSDGKIEYLLVYFFLDQTMRQK